jgi:hypothetical protein
MGLDMMSVHTPPQVLLGAAQPQTPFEHAWPPWHALVQEPQWVGSLNRFAQLLLLQTCSLAMHEPVHAPAEHKRPAPQVLPHVPQFAPSEAVFTQSAPQAARPPAQTHAPPEHIWPVPQVLPQPPQLPLSFKTSTHLAMHTISPPGHGAFDLPALPAPPVPLRPPEGGV